MHPTLLPGGQGGLLGGPAAGGERALLPRGVRPRRHARSLQPGCWLVDVPRQQRVAKPAVHAGDGIWILQHCKGSGQRSADLVCRQQSDKIDTTETHYCCGSLSSACRYQNRRHRHDLWMLAACMLMTTHFQPCREHAALTPAASHMRTACDCMQQLCFNHPILHAFLALLHSTMQLPC